LGLKDELIRFLKEQIEIENSIVKSLNASLNSIKNPSVKGVLKGISLDSVKHAEMHVAALELLTEAGQALTEERFEEQKRLVEEHIDLETRLIKRISEEIPKVTNEKIKLLLEAILSDERRHHQLLKEVLKILVRGETITEDEWLDLIWKNVPFHGSPGG